MGVLNLKRPSRNFQLKGSSLAATLSRFYLLHNTELTMVVIRKVIVLTWRIKQNMYVSLKQTNPLTTNLHPTNPDITTL